ncbi:MAG: hypothetical protein JNK67_06830 [Alphaproteobacteria bacterium]|nr:hypothetical protein [Alphaproteobacteria bacterium]
MTATGSAFRAGISRKLRRLGLRGRSVVVGLAGSRLTIAGDTFGTVDIELASISRLRVGFAQSRGQTYHQILVWTDRAAAPLLLGTADAAEHPRFAVLVRGLAAALAGGEPPALIETGESKRWAAVMLALFGALAAGFAALLAFVLTASETSLGVPRPVALAVPAALLLGTSTAMWWAWTRHWPRRIDLVEDLARVLPR